MKHKKLIIALIIIAIVISIICVICIQVLNINSAVNNENKDEDGNIPENPETLNITYETEKLRNLTEFFSVESCIQEHINDTFSAEDMNFLAVNSICSYSVYGKISNPDTQETQDIYMIVRVDTDNLTFEIEELDNTYNNIDEIDLTTDITEIASTGDNEFEYTRVTNEQACRIYLDMLKESLLTDPESAFAKLDETYRNERFSSYEEFLSYIEGNRIRLEEATLDEYEVVNNDEYTEYRIVDNNNNNYIIRATTVMDYTVQLDAYTIQTEEYQEQYANLADVQKASVNVDLFIRMLNARDYSHAYAVLSEGFRNNYFPTEQDFINYVQENFYDYIIFTNNSHTNEGDVYIFNVTLIGGASSAAESQERTFNILLGEGTDFTLSFNME